jgi:hypothetical protein
MRTLRLRSSLQLLSLAVILPAAAHAQAWHASGCDPALEPELQAYEQSVRSATPGTTVFAPKPFPITASDVIVDARYAYLRIYRDPAALPGFEKKLYGWLTSGQYVYRVDRVANWTPARCRRGDRHLSYFLVTLQDPGTGRPVGRMALNEAGLLMEWASNPVQNLPRLGDLVTTVTTQFRITPEHAQLATVWGDIDCISPLDPCLAFEAGGKSYLWARNGLYVFEASSRLAATESSAIRNFGSYQGAKAKLAPDEALVSLAAEGWAKARKVQPPG